MISVIICSSNPVLLEQAKINIEETIGVPHEIIYEDNRELNTGICSVYNSLALKATFRILCFVHEDVLFTSTNWGNIIINHFANDTQIGLIGLAGCKYKSAFYSGWYSHDKKLDCANYVHQYNHGTERVYLSPAGNRELQEVVCIDGVFMCCKKEVWEKNKFNEKVLRGFHFYDIDFSLRVARENKVMVTYDVSLTHITSGGDYGNKWVEIAIEYHQFMKGKLPYSKIPVDTAKTNAKIINATMDFLKKYPISFKNKIKWIRYQKLYSNPSYYYSILKFLLYKTLGLNPIHKIQWKK
jgi:hypothetical protein